MSVIEIALKGINGKEVPAVTSLQVAESFEKEHKNVLRDIEAILPQVPEKFVKLNFELYEYPIETGIGTRMAKSYLLSKDAFTLLTMGYTGEKAMAFKVAYIARFNEMEKALQANAPTSLPEALRAYANILEENELIRRQRDEAIRTKAWISDKKTASAMATASVAVRKAAALENELGRGRDLTGSTKKPDAQTTDFLRNSPGILWALDFDEAGRKASSWWREHFPGMRTWPCAAGKDPGEMLKVGIPIRPWLEAVLLCEPAPCRETHKNAPQSAERQKHDSGLMPQLEPSANDTLERLAALDTNIAALVGWEVAPHLQDGELVIDGLDRLDAENRAGLERWFAHKGPNGEPRRERVIRALRTGRRAAC